MRRPDTGVANSRASGRAHLACQSADRALTSATPGPAREAPESRATSSSARSDCAPIARGRALAGKARIHRSVDRRLRKNRKIRDLRKGMGTPGHSHPLRSLSPALTPFRDVRSGRRRGPHFFSRPSAASHCQRERAAVAFGSPFTSGRLCLAAAAESSQAKPVQSIAQMQAILSAPRYV